MHEVPGWVRVKYLKEVLEYFVGISEISPCRLYIVDLCDAICINLKLQDAILMGSSGTEMENYLSNVIRNCKWFQFYDAIEVIGDVVATEDMESIERYQIEVELGSDMIIDYWAHAVVRLENCSFEIYRQKVNELLISISTNFQFGEDGMLFPINEDGSQIINGNSEHLYRQIPIYPRNVEDQLSIDDTDDLILFLESNKFIHESNRESIINSVNQYRQGKVKDSLILIYPEIESAISARMRRVGGSPEKFNGLPKKVEWLEKEGHLPPYLSKMIGFFKSNRNHLVHGDLPISEDLLEPMFTFAFRYLLKLLNYNSYNNKNANPYQ